MSDEKTTAPGGGSATRVMPAVTPEAPSSAAAVGAKAPEEAAPRRAPWRPGAKRSGEDAEGTTESPPQSRPGAGTPDAKAAAGPRRVRLAVSRIDPWSVMKLSFLLSIAIGIALVVSVAVVWNVLNTMEVFTQADRLVTDIAGTETFINILEYVEFSRVMSIAVVVAVVDVVIITALATLFAFLYNIVAALVGGLHVTLTDE